MRLATFNVENMFERAAVMNLSTWAEGKEALEDFKRLNELINKSVYSTHDKTEMLEIMNKHSGLIANSVSQFIRLQKIRGQFLKNSQSEGPTIVASGRDDWIGWFELVTELITEAAIENTARVINEVAPDIQCVIEAENRLVLKRFNDAVIPKIGGEAFKFAMLIDGNDDRGIDVGVLSKANFPILSMISHVFDHDNKGIIFSRDCTEYLILLPSGEKLLLLVNHFKSKGFGSTASSNQKRLRQAQRVREIYERRLSEGMELIAVLGDLNDTPDSEPLEPLLQNNSSLVDIMTIPQFISDGRPGTHGNGTKSAKLDYILISPKLLQKVTSAGIERRGVWGGKHGTLFPHFPEIKSEKDAASDHAALWVDLDI